MIINLNKIGDIMHGWAKDLFLHHRSLTGVGVRQTLEYLGQILPGLNMNQIKSGSKVFDWEIPNEWSIRDAYIADQSGKRIVDLHQSNLHVVGYSDAVDTWMNREELDKHLYSLPENPTVIPYVTSYYKKQWGFCLTHEQRLKISAGLYHVVIDSDLKSGALNYADLIIHGETQEEVLLSTYICHPSLANNELSGPVVAAAIALWIQSLEVRRYTYRIVFVPETIGSIAYLSRNLQWMRSHTIAGFVLTCLGDDRCYSYLPSRKGNSLSDQAALNILKHIDPQFVRYSWLDRGSDERQYCAPGVDLPVASIMRSKYGQYKEYHNSGDNLDFITPSGLEGGFTAVRRAIEIIEQNYIPIVTVLCEPQLGKRGLYPSVSDNKTFAKVSLMMNIISYCDGSVSLLDIAELLNCSFFEVKDLVDKLVAEGLMEKLTTAKK